MNQGRQSGISLISMMIGMFISTLCILASLTLYKSLIQVAAESKLDTSFDGQMSTALMVAQMEIQAAGYGIDEADADDIQLRTTAASGGTNATSELLWRYSEGGTFNCRSLVDETVTVTENSESVTYRQLTLKTATANCDATTPLASMTWGNPSVLARWNLLGQLGSYVESGNNLFNFSLAPVNCSPYGAVTQNRHLQLTIVTPSSTTLNTANVALNNLEICLANTYPS